MASKLKITHYLSIKGMGIISIASCNMFVAKTHGKPDALPWIEFDPIFINACYVISIIN
jgi:hypothetical protein